MVRARDHWIGANGICVGIVVQPDGGTAVSLPEEGTRVAE
jgi:hypothetical protein